MIKSYQYLDIDINKKTYKRLRAVQGDSKSRYILVSLYDNSKAYNLSNCSVKVFGCKSDKKIFFNYAIVTDVINGKFEIELTNQALAVAGELEIQILILGTNQERLTTFSFFIDVNKTIVDDAAIESTNEFTALTEALSSVQNIDNRFREVDEQFNTKASLKETQNLQTQINNLVLVSDGTQNAEVVQSRGSYSTLNDRLNNEFNYLDKSSLLYSNNINVNKIDFNSKYYNVNGTTNAYQNSCAIGFRFIDSFKKLKESGYNLTNITITSIVTLKMNTSSSTSIASLKLLAKTTGNDMGDDTGVSKQTLYNGGYFVVKNITSGMDYSSLSDKLDLYLWLYSNNTTTNVNYDVFDVKLFIDDIELQCDTVGSLEGGCTGVITEKSNLTSLINLTNVSPLKGKKIVAIGDSMVQGHTLLDNQTWLYKLANRNNMTYVNHGVNGTYMTNKLYDGNKGVVDRFVDMGNDADYVVVFAGTNDAANNVTIGEDNSTNPTEFKGALNIICDGLLTKYPSKKIMFITPYLRNSGYENYIDAIETICAKYGIRVFNNMKNGGVCWSNSAQVNTLTLGDTYHLNEYGMEYASYKYEEELKRL